MSGYKDIYAPLGSGEFAIITVTDPALVPDALMLCPTHGSEMWWDYEEAGWWCADCGMWHPNPGGEHRVPRGWMPNKLGGKL